MTKDQIAQIASSYGNDMWVKVCVCQEQAEEYTKSAKHFLEWCDENGYRVISEDEIRKAWSEHKDNPDISKLFTDLFTDKT